MAHLVNKENRMEKIFAEMKEKGEKVLILYFPVGDPALGDSVDWAEKYFKNGNTVLEIGLPYENPVLDGSVVKGSMERALEKIDVDGAFEIIREMRKRCPDNILQIMTYYEIIERYGAKKFAEICHDIDVDAVLTPNASVEAIKELDDELGKYNIVNLRFVPYHLNDEVIEDVKNNAQGYAFLQAVDGGTGMQSSVSEQVRVNIDIFKKENPQCLLCPGFGISNAEQVAEVMSMGAEGCIVGSAVVKHILAGDGEEFIRSLREACEK